MEDEPSPPPTRFQLPGFGLPLNYAPQSPITKHTFVGNDVVEIVIPGVGEGRDLFPTVLNGKDLRGERTCLPLTTSREFTMCELMNDWTDRVDWENKVFDEEEVLKLKAEARTYEAAGFTEAMMEWCVMELRYKAGIFARTGGVSVFDGGVVKSDTAISKDVVTRLQAATIALENAPVRERLWQVGPQEGEIVLVDPYMHPLVYGISKVLPDSVLSLEDSIQRCGEGVTIPVPLDEEMRLDSTSVLPPTIVTVPFSGRFQMLPFEVDISGDKPRITSYINNIHPNRHKGLYAIIEDVISAVIPLWNMTLTAVKASPQIYNYNRIVYKKCLYDPDILTLDPSTYPPQEPGEPDRAYDQRILEWELAICEVVQPEPGTFQPPTVPEHLREEWFEAGTDVLSVEKSVDLKRDYGARGLQIIVKMFNIVLTPDQPEYPGGDWHGEGQMNEHICATALYYYDDCNVTESDLEFRQHSQGRDTAEVEHLLGRFEWLEAVFGCDINGPPVQLMGGINLQQGRVVTFPSIIQTRVGALQLENPNEPGHRKVLGLFLVDPGIRIISTANVPCQQKGWWTDEVTREGSMLMKLPNEVRDYVFEQVQEFPFGVEEAVRVAEEMRTERVELDGGHLLAFEGDEFYLA